MEQLLGTAVMIVLTVGHIPAQLRRDRCAETTFAVVLGEYLNDTIGGIRAIKCRVVEFAVKDLGLELLGLAESPIRGKEMGNIEYLSYWRKTDDRKVDS